MYYERAEAGITFMKEEIDEDPEKFDNEFRNVQNYVEVKLKADIKQKKEEESLRAPDYLKLEEEYKKKLKEIMHTHKISVGSPD